MTSAETPDRRRRNARARRRQEERWKRKAGPLTVRFDPSIIREDNGG